MKNAIRCLVTACALALSACSDDGVDISATGTINGVDVSFPVHSNYYTTDVTHQMTLETADGVSTLEISIARSAPFGTYDCTSTGLIEYGAFLQNGDGPLYSTTNLPGSTVCTFFITDEGGDGNGTVEFLIYGTLRTTTGETQPIDLTVTMRGVN